MAAMYCFMAVFCVFLSIISDVGCFQEDEFDGLSTLVVEHSLDSGLKPVFSRRGTITIQSVTAGNAYFTPESRVHESDRHRLRELAEKDGDYLIRVGSKAVGSGDGQMEYVYSFVKACALYEARLHDNFTVHVDSGGGVFAVSYQANLSYCTGIRVPDEDLSNFDSDVRVNQALSGPSPDTQVYVMKMEQERAERAKGQQADNRSFLAKYWMYIVPVFLVLMFANSAADPNAGGGGGGR